MAANLSVKILAKATELGDEKPFAEAFDVTATLTKATSNRQIQASADTDEALNLCGISTVELIIIKATSNDLLIDSDYVSSFDSDIIVPEGECAIFKPAGVVRIKNEDAGEACTVDYLISGSA